MIVWQIMDPYTSSISITDDINIYGKYQCQSNFITSWVIAELVFTVSEISNLKNSNRSFLKFRIYRVQS